MKHVIASEAKQSPILGIEIALSLRSSQRHSPHFPLSLWSIDQTVSVGATPCGCPGQARGPAPTWGGSSCHRGSRDTCNHTCAILDAALQCSRALRGFDCPADSEPSYKLGIVPHPVPNASPLLPIRNPAFGRNRNHPAQSRGGVEIGKQQGPSFPASLRPHTSHNSLRINSLHHTSHAGWHGQTCLTVLVSKRIVR